MPAPRCKNGTRRNKKTGKCEPTKTKTKKLKQISTKSTNTNMEQKLNNMEQKLNLNEYLIHEDLQQRINNDNNFTKTGIPPKNFGNKKEEDKYSTLVTKLIRIINSPPVFLRDFDEKYILNQPPNMKIFVFKKDNILFVLERNKDPTMMTMYVLKTNKNKLKNIWNVGAGA